jgi:hypothetical protein
MTLFKNCIVTLCECFRDLGSPAEYGAGLKLAIERGWPKMHESGTFVTFTPAGAELFA